MIFDLPEQIELNGQKYILNITAKADHHNYQIRYCSSPTKRDGIIRLSPNLDRCVKDMKEYLTKLGLIH